MEGPCGPEGGGSRQSHFLAILSLLNDKKEGPENNPGPGFRFLVTPSFNPKIELKYA